MLDVRISFSQIYSEVLVIYQCEVAFHLPSSHLVWEQSLRSPAHFCPDAGPSEACLVPSPRSIQLHGDNR